MFNKASRDHLLTDINLSVLSDGKTLKLYWNKSSWTVVKPLFTIFPDSLNTPFRFYTMLHNIKTLIDTKPRFCKVLMWCKVQGTLLHACCVTTSGTPVHVYESYIWFKVILIRVEAAGLNGFGSWCVQTCLLLIFYR